MEISTEIKGNTRWHTIKGVIDIAELTTYLKTLYKASDFDSSMNVFWNLIEADFTLVSPKDVERFGDFVREYWGKGGGSKAAIVVSHDLGFGMSRMYQILMELDSSSEIVVFKDIDEAKKWIKSE